MEPAAVDAMVLERPNPSYEGQSRGSTSTCHGDVFCSSDENVDTAFKQVVSFPYREQSLKTKVGLSASAGSDSGASLRCKRQNL